MTRRCVQTTPTGSTSLSASTSTTSSSDASETAAPAPAAAAAAAAASGGSRVGRTPKNMAQLLGVSLLQLDIDQLAAAITHDDFALFEKIESREFLDNAWQRKRPSLAPNLRAFIARFNALSCWVASAVVLESELKTRTRLFERFVALLASLRTLNNFSGIMAVISGLNNSGARVRARDASVSLTRAHTRAAVLRLSFTRARISKKAQQELTDMEHLMNMEGASWRCVVALVSVHHRHRRVSTISTCNQTMCTAVCAGM
jgi:hypothetical protein